MAGLEASHPPIEPDLPGCYSAIPAPDRPDSRCVVLDPPSRARPVGYLEAVEDGTFRAYYGGLDGEPLGRVETVDGGVSLVAVYHRAKLTVEWCRTWGHLDALHDRAEDLAAWDA